MTRLQILLTDDWELRGDGSGDMQVLQLESLDRLLAIYERYGLRATIMAEVMQQLSHRAWGQQVPELGALADAWEAHVRNAVQRGHDVQLHLHPQWVGASYRDGRWHLPGAWPLPQHPADEVRRLVREGKNYLETLIRSVDPGYRCIGFRAGMWCLTPSDHVLRILAEEGITLDVSVVPGIRVGKVQDYRHCEEELLPFCPDLRDARKLAPTRTPIVCLPTFTFREPRGYWPPASRPYRMARFLKACVAPATVIADLAYMDQSLWQRMFDSLHERAAACGWPVLPVVLANHTKDIRDFELIEKLAADLAGRKDLEVITLADLARRFEEGVYQPVMKRTGT